MQKNLNLIPALVFCLLSVMVLSAAVYIWRSDQQASLARAKVIAQQLTNSMEILSADRMRALADFANNWPVASANQVDWFNVKATTLAKMLPGLQNIVLTGQQGELLWATDNQLRKQGLQLNLASHLGLSQGLPETAIIYPQQQPQYVIASRQVVINSQIIGHISFFFDLNAILSVLTDELKTDSLQFTIADGDVDILRFGRMNAHFPVAQNAIRFAGRDWQVQVQSRIDGLSIPLFIVLIGSTVALLLAGLLRSQFKRDRQVQRYQELYQSAATASLDAIAIFSVELRDGQGPDFLLQQFNQVAQQLFQPLQFAAGQSYLSALCATLDAADFFAQVGKVFLCGVPFEGVFRSKSSLLQAQWLRVQVVRSANGLAMTFRDVSQLKHEEQLLAQNEAKYRRLVEGIAGHFIYRTSASGQLEFVSNSVQAILGYPLADFQQHYLDYVLQYFTEPQLIDQQLRQGQTPAPYLVQYRTQQGEKVLIEYRATPVKDSAGKVIAIEGIGRDVTAEHALHSQIRYQADHDQLTGLYNRYAFERELSQLLAQSGNACLCYIDMDQFKLVNDSCGHLAGDELLRNVANILSTNLQPADILARVGGDEFCLVLANTPLESAKLKLKELLERISTFRFCWEQQVFSIGASIGVVELNQTLLSPVELLKAADAGCYLAKANGKNRYFVVDAAAPELNHLQQERQLLALIRQALAEDGFLLYAQPIVPLSAADGGSHCEILLRLPDAQGQLVSPAIFIPLAEQQGLMHQIDRWVFDAVLSQLEQDTGYLAGLDKCAINLSGLSLGDAELLAHIKQRLAQSKVPAQKICFEITETAAVTNMAAAQHFIQSLKAIGCRFSLDDFGVGMSSFSYLKHMPVDYIKIDGSFIKNMAVDQIDAVMVRAISDIAHSLQKATIAEFVPDQHCANLLRQMGVAYGQGYGIAEPTLWSVLRQRQNNAVAPVWLEAAS